MLDLRRGQFKGILLKSCHQTTVAIEAGEVMLKRMQTHWCQAFPRVRGNGPQVLSKSRIILVKRNPLQRWKCIRAEAGWWRGSSPPHGRGRDSSLSRQPLADFFSFFLSVTFYSSNRVNFSLSLATLIAPVGPAGEEEWWITWQAGAFRLFHAVNLYYSSILIFTSST